MLQGKVVDPIRFSDDGVFPICIDQGIYGPLKSKDYANEMKDGNLITLQGGNLIWSTSCRI